MRMLSRYVLLVAVSGGMVGCTTVQPWEREVLARPEMNLGFEHVSRALEDHVYFSKEASSGGRGFGGGGCGCN